MLPYKGTFRITKLYGTNPPPGMTYSAGKHPGVDLVGVSDKTIYAVKGGVVIRNSEDYSGWGRYVVVHQTDGLYAIYAHLITSYVKLNKVVKEGDLIGIEGSTGKVTGRHLHLEFRKNYADKYGLDKTVVYPHSFRHRYAKNFLEKYNDIALLADLMGNESIETTLIYLRRTASEQQALVDKIVTW